MTEIEVMQNIYKLTEKKESHFKQLVQWMEESAFLGIDEEADAFNRYYEKRQVIFDDITKLDKIIDDCKKSLPTESFKDSTQYKEVSTKEANIKEMTKKILDADIENNEKMKKASKQISDEIKKINKAKMSSNRYQTIEYQNDGVFIDKKK